MYRQIAARPSVDQIYAQVLADEAGLAKEMLEELEQRVREALAAAFDKPAVDVPVGFSDKWRDISSHYSDDPVDTAVTFEQLSSLARKMAVFPAGFVPHAKIGTLLQKRLEAVLSKGTLDWGNAETLAYATLLDQGYSVRISGQDSQRGTFNHRHCVVIDSQTEQNHIPLTAVAQAGAGFQAWNSSLSEFGVLGFEYGYSLEAPNCLTIWEAQFGDFANGAQVVIDQFIASGETKWHRASGLVLLLPHGYEGQGAEHSSARIERYLQLCAAENMIVACPSTPAQMFHLLRRQMMQAFRKPLIVFTPKSLLRHPVCVSAVADFCKGMFQTCLASASSSANVRQVLFCSGKIYYDLEQERIRLERDDIDIVRIEQLYPLDIGAVRRIIDRYSQECRLMWVQEEPENMGAWQYIERQFTGMSVAIGCIARPEDCCPAVGSHHIHAEQQADILRRAYS
jgi:2-oxoglutarate dehydrogenase E1 component